VFIYFVNFKSLKHSNIFSKIIWWYFIANKNGQIGTTLNYRSKTNFSISISNYTIYYFLKKCFDQCQCSVMASRWSIYTYSTVENKFFYLCCRKIFSEFSNICPNGGRCIWEKHYIDIASSLQISGFVKCFIYKISLSSDELNHL
jgi:hypothetical protein